MITIKLLRASRKAHADRAVIISRIDRIIDRLGRINSNAAKPVNQRPKALEIDQHKLIDRNAQELAHRRLGQGSSAARAELLLTHGIRCVDPPRSATRVRHPQVAGYREHAHPPAIAVEANKHNRIRTGRYRVAGTSVSAEQQNVQGLLPQSWRRLNAGCSREQVAASDVRLRLSVGRRGLYTTRYRAICGQRDRYWRYDHRVNIVKRLPPLVGEAQRRGEYDEAYEYDGAENEAPARERHTSCSPVIQC